MNTRNKKDSKSNVVICFQVPSMPTQNTQAKLRSTTLHHLTITIKRQAHNAPQLHFTCFTTLSLFI